MKTPTPTDSQLQLKLLRTQRPGNAAPTWRNVFPFRALNMWPKSLVDKVSYWLDWTSKFLHNTLRVFRIHFLQSRNSQNNTTQIHYAAKEILWAYISWGSGKTLTLDVGIETFLVRLHCIHSHNTKTNLVVPVLLSND